MDTKSYYSAIFFSDFHKRSGDLQEIGFIDELVDYINKRCKNTFVSINDINLCCSKGGGRDCFDIFRRKFRTTQHLKMHFNNCHRQPISITVKSIPIMKSFLI